MKTIAIILTNLVLLQSLHIDFKDISNTSVLLNHAKLHQEKYGDSFVDFIYEHYIEREIPADKQHQEHQDLPFKQGVSHFNHLVPALELNSHQFELKTPKKSFSKPCFFYEESESNFEKPGIFQPPKYS
jgi:hypothetical protein